MVLALMPSCINRGTFGLIRHQWDVSVGPGSFTVSCNISPISSLASGVSRRLRAPQLSGRTFGWLCCTPDSRAASWLSRTLLLLQASNISQMCEFYILHVLVECRQLPFFSSKSKTNVLHLLLLRTIQLPHLLTQLGMLHLLHVCKQAPQSRLSLPWACCFAALVSPQSSERYVPDPKMDENCQHPFLDDSCT